MNKQELNTAAAKAMTEEETPCLVMVPDFRWFLPAKDSQSIKHETHLWDYVQFSTYIWARENVSGFCHIVRKD